MKRTLTSLVLALVMCLSLCVSAFAYTSKPVHYYNPETIVSPESVGTSQITYPGAPTPDAINGNQKMDTPVILYTMTGNALSPGKLVTTDHYYDNPWQCFKSNFATGVVAFVSRLSSSDTSGQVKVGLCKIDSSGNYVADVYTYVSANGTSTKYPGTSNMNANLTYYGFINNTTSGVTSGSVDIGYLR